MKTNLHHYRLAGVVGGLLLAAGQFWGPACLLQIVALLPLMILVLKDRRVGPAALCGFYMGIAYSIPQMVYLRMPVPVTAALLVWMTLLLTLLCVSIAYFLPKHPIFGPLAVGAVWYILDWVNYTAIPVWGLSQSFARSWTAYPFAIQFVSITGISGVLFVIGTLAGLSAHVIVPCGIPNGTQASCFRRTQRRLEACVPLTAIALLLVIMFINTIIWIQKPVTTLKVAAAGWVFDDRILPVLIGGFNSELKAGCYPPYHAVCRWWPAAGDFSGLKLLKNRGQKAIKFVCMSGISRYNSALSV